MDGSKKEPGQDAKWKRPAVATACLLAAVLLVSLVEPPEKLVDFIGSDFWARAALGVLVFLVLYMITSTSGLVEAKVGLPLGLSVDGRNQQQSAELTSLLELGARLEGLHSVDQEQLALLEELAVNMRDLEQRVLDIERRI